MQCPPDRMPTYEIPEITAAMVKQALGRKAKRTAAGQDSWHMDELASLPKEALEGLARLYNVMEQQQRVPFAMAQAWMALVPKSASASAPLAVRPISVLASTYRLWASLRASQVQAWADVTFHRWQVAYVKGRSARVPLAQLNVLMDQAVQNGEQLYVISLDASRAFPSVQRDQANALLKMHGFPPQLCAVTESLYELGVTTMRYAGHVVADRGFRLRKGIHQGCPLSILGFNILLTPLCRRLEEIHKIPLSIVYADDITVIARTYEQLVAALEDIEQHLRCLGIGLNPSKSQYWAAQHETRPVTVGGIPLKLQQHLTILGMTHSPHRQHRDTKNAFVQAYRRAAGVLSSLPMPVAYKENAVAAILLSAAACCPWQLYADAKLLSIMRKDLVIAARGYLQHGCRSTVVITAGLMKAHWLDPVVLPAVKLIKLLADVGPMATHPLNSAYKEAREPCSLVTVLAAYLKRLGTGLDDMTWYPLANEPLRLLGPSKNTKEAKSLWLHQVRDAVKHSAIASAAAHRHEFGDLRNAALDFDGSLKLYRTLKAGRQRAYLELALAGGMLTNERMHRHRGVPWTSCPYGCDTPDTEIHRFWGCPRWAASREGLGWAEALPPLTKCTGWFLKGHECSSVQIFALQRHLGRVIADATAQYHSRNRQPFGDYGSLEVQPDTCDGNDDGQDCGGEGDVGGGVPPPGAVASAGGHPCGAGFAALGGGALPVPPPVRESQVDEEDGSGVGNKQNQDSGGHDGGAKNQEQNRVPEHIHFGVRRLHGVPAYKRELVACRVCSKVGARCRLQHFIKRHEVCAGGVWGARPEHTSLTLYEKRLLSDAGIDTSFPASKKRRLGENAGLHADTW